MTTERPYLLLAVVAFAATMWAAQRWSDKDPAQWTVEDAQRILTASPWAQETSASFGTATEPRVPVGPMPDPSKGGHDGASDGRWDGGVARNDGGGVPSLPMMIRWDTALPVREALSRTNAQNYAPVEAQKDYVVTVLGLVPGGNYRRAGRLETQSTSGDADGRDARDPEEMLEGLMGTSRLFPKGKAPIAPEDVKLDPATGAIHLFFPRTESISLKDKEVLFATRFGSMKIEKRFRLKDMTYKGRLEL